MRITPLDVRKQEFRKAVRGYDSDEVRGFLTTLAEEYETVLVDNKSLRETVAQQDEKLKEYTKLESTLRDTLMTAQQVMADTKENAAHEGQLIVEEARQQAHRILSECRVHTEELRREIIMLRQEKETYLARFRSLAQAQIQFVEAHEQDFADTDRRLLEMADTLVGGAATTAPAAPAASYTSVAPTAGPTAVSAPPQSSAPAVSGTDSVDRDQWRDYAPLNTVAGQDQAVDQDQEVASATKPATTPAATPAVDESTEQVANSLAEAVEMASKGIPVPAVDSGTGTAGKQEPKPVEASVLQGEPQVDDVAVPV